MNTKRLLAILVWIINGLVFGAAFSMTLFGYLFSSLDPTGNGLWIIPWLAATVLSGYTFIRLTKYLHINI